LILSKILFIIDFSFFIKSSNFIYCEKDSMSIEFSISKIVGFARWLGMCFDGRFFYNTIPLNKIAVVLSASVTMVFILTCLIMSIELS
jgi:hypothetical protein